MHLQFKRTVSKPLTEHLGILQVLGAGCAAAVHRAPVPINSPGGASHEEHEVIQLALCFFNGIAYFLFHEIAQ